MSNIFFSTDKKISDYLHGKFFRCVGRFLPWLKIGETYWFEYHGNGEYEVRSDNNLGKRFNMSQLQLITKFVPTEVEDDISFALTYGFWLSDRGVHHTNLDNMINYYHNKKEKL